MAEQNDDVSEEVSDNENEGSNSKFSAIKKLFSNKIILISTLSLLVIIVAAASYFLFFSADEPDENSIQQTEVAQDAAAQETDKTEPELTPIAEDITNETTLDSQTTETISSAKVLAEPELELELEPKIEATPNDIVAADDLPIEDSNTAMEHDTEQLKNELMSLTQQVTALQQENKNLQQKVNTLITKTELSPPSNQLSPTSDTAAKSTLSKPIRENDTIPTLPSGFDAYDNSNYFSSPYADDEQTPEPTWGK